MTKSISITLLLGLLLAAAAVADGDKTLENMKGSVSHQIASAAAVPLAVNARISVSDREVAITGPASLAAIDMPDSSQVLVGADSKVQLAAFVPAVVTTANFVVYDGRVRFAVRHPKGAKANYTFQTPTATVGVRGTQGDIAYDPDGALRVNVYEVCNPDAPVVVTAKGGQTYTVAAGQSLVARLVGGVVQAQVEQLTQGLIDQFTGDFGVPQSWDQAKGQVVAYAQNQTTGAVNSVTGGYGGQAVPALGGLFGHKATPSPAPAAHPATCS